MRILIISAAYDNITQRIHTELLERKHQVSIEIALNEWLMVEAVRLFKPRLIICPMLTKALPDTIWRNTPCLMLHPGANTDRSPSPLDWAIQEQQPITAVTGLQKAASLEESRVWASVSFPLRHTDKSSLYAIEIAEASVQVVLKTLSLFENSSEANETPATRACNIQQPPRPAMRQSDRHIDWQKDSTASIISKINAADGWPGVLDRIADEEFYLYGASAEQQLRGNPGQLLASRHGAVCRATQDAAIWISHLKRPGDEQTGLYLKLPAMQVLGAKASHLTEAPLALNSTESNTFRDIWYSEQGDIAYLHFNCYGGRISSAQCLRLLDALIEVQTTPAKIVVLQGGRATWLNGIDYNIIEAAASPAEETWQNIAAMNDVILQVLNTANKITIAALHGNASASGIALALACDKICVRSGVVLNPYYKTMGLYGSDYWTYSLPKRVGYEKSLDLTEACRTIGSLEAKRMGLIDMIIPEAFAGFDQKLHQCLTAFIKQADLKKILQHKNARREQDEFVKPLKYYRSEELRHNHTDIFGPKTLYHQLRKRFVYHIPSAETPARLAIHHLPMFNAGISNTSIRDSANQNELPQAITKASAH